MSSPARSAVVAVLGAAAVVALLATWAAVIGPGAVLSGDGLEPVRIEPTATSETEEPGGRPNDLEQMEEEPPEAPAWLRAVVIGVMLVALAELVLLLGLAARRLWRAWRDRERREPLPEEVAFETLSPGRAVAHEIVEDARAQRSLLLEGDPRNAIVACWHRFEVQAAAGGVARRSWETPAEFTLRVLDLAAADASAVTRLSDLYREARFSDHHLGEDRRTEALAALDAIHDSLHVRGRS